MHESGGPFIFVAGMNALKSFFHVCGIKPDQRILADFGAVNGLSPDLIDGALAPLFFLFLSKSAGRNEYNKQQQKNWQGKMILSLHSLAHSFWLANRASDLRKKAGRNCVRRSCTYKLHTQLERELQAQLHGTAAPRADDGIRRRNVWRRTTTTERLHRRIV